jgi:ubiquinone/menaquinone biosynthesis C-methylase UbiE
VTVGDDVRGASEIEQFFDETASVYDSAYANRGPGGRVLRRRAATTLALLGEGPGKVLDAGMGSGYLCAELDRRGWTVHGIDISSAMVEGAVARLPHVRDRLRRGSIIDLPYADASFDAVVATGVLEFVPEELDRAVSEVSRVLRPGCAAVVSFPNYRAPVTAWRGRVLYPVVRLAKSVVPGGLPAPPRVPQGRFGQLTECLERAGLIVEVVRPVGSRPLPARTADRLDRSGSWLAKALAVQYVVRARKTAR